MTQEAEKMKELLKDAQDHPLMKQILAEKAAATLATRTEAAGKIEALKKEREEVIPGLLADIEVKEADYLKAKAAADAALFAAQALKARLYSARLDLDSDIRQHEVVLYETADPLIDEAQEFFRGKSDSLRVPKIINTSVMAVETNIFTMKKKLTGQTNLPAIQAALAYCQAAIKELEGMKLSPALDLERIETLKAGIPKVDVYIESTGEKPMDLYAQNPLAGFPSDSQHDWTMRGLNERFKKLMRK
jgi:hypothetical protein